MTRLRDSRVAGGPKVHRAKTAGWVAMIVLVLEREHSENQNTQHQGDDQRYARSAFHNRTPVVIQSATRYLTRSARPESVPPCRPPRKTFAFARREGNALQVCAQLPPRAFALVRASINGSCIQS